MSKITYVIGDATDPQGTGKKVLAHVCNDAGGWGKGFVNAISARWTRPEHEYRRWYRAGLGGTERFELGMVQLVEVGPEIAVANLVAQHGYRSPVNPTPLRYEALTTCMTKLASKLAGTGTTVHMPKLGTGLAGGDWARIAQIIESTLCASGVEVIVYEPTPGKGRQ